MQPSTAALSQEFPFHGSTPKQFLVIAVDIAQELNWDIGSVSDVGMIAFSSSFNEGGRVKLTLSLARFSATLTSHITHNIAEEYRQGEKAIHDFTSALYNNTNVYSSKELAARYEELKPYLVPPQEELLPKGPSGFEKSKAELLSVFIPRAGYFITPWLIIINTSIFFLTLLYDAITPLSYKETMIRFGANVTSATRQGQWWRLLTSTFLHWEVLHFLMNMVALYIIGFYLEPYVSRAKYLCAYLLTGILASLTSVYWHEQVVSAGASGAIFGLYGVFLSLLATRVVAPSERGSLLAGMVVFIGYNLIGSNQGNTDNVAHIGGFVGGLIIGLAFHPALRKLNM